MATRIIFDLVLIVILAVLSPSIVVDGYLMKLGSFPSLIGNQPTTIAKNTLTNRKTLPLLMGVERKYSDLINYFDKDNSVKIRKPSSSKVDITGHEDFKTIETIVKLADWRKANDITVLYLGEGVAEFTNFMVKKINTKVVLVAICSVL